MRALRNQLAGRLSALLAVALFATAALRAQQPAASSRSGTTIAPGGRFVLSADGLTVHDDLLHVTWLVDFNLPAKEKFGLPTSAGGAMTYPTARKWIAALNSSNRGAGYLGRKNWTLPATPATDETCTVARGPHGNSSGFNCANSTLGSLYYRGLGLRQPNTAVPIPASAVGPFKNFQPYLYWSLNGKEKNRRQMRRENGKHAFSFNTGWQGGNVSDHVMYVLPMIEGRLAASAPAAGTELQPSTDGQTVYDPQMNVTWLANANLAAETRFNVAGIVADGAMARTTADDFIHNVQPYLYWSCAGAIGRTTCSGAPAAPGFEWSFSFGNGFQGTDVIGNSLYVTVYARDPEAPR